MQAGLLFVEGTRMCAKGSLKGRLRIEEIFSHTILVNIWNLYRKEFS